MSIDVNSMSKKEKEIHHNKSFVEDKIKSIKEKFSHIEGELISGETDFENVLVLMDACEKEMDGVSEIGENLKKLNQ